MQRHANFCERLWVHPAADAFSHLPRRCTQPPVLPLACCRGVEVAEATLPSLKELLQRAEGATLRLCSQGLRSHMPADQRAAPETHCIKKILSARNAMRYKYAQIATNLGLSTCQQVCLPPFRSS